IFTGYDDPENSEVYEDELYLEESSSERSVDSEVEFHLYSQIHYSQDLGEVRTLEMNEEADAGEVVGQSSGLAGKQDEDENLTELTDGGAQLSDEPEVIVLSDTPEEDSIYKSKAKRSRCSSSAPGKAHACPVSSTPNHNKAAGCSARSEEEEEEEESLISDGEDVESWMLLGAGADDTDGDIMLNLEGCATPARKGQCFSLACWFLYGDSSLSAVTLMLVLKDEQKANEFMAKLW
uniref:ZCHC7 protein n=1 Tax=Zonotrichia albicollis TaxID=44394 RepID=A0A8D2MCS3_ZONAL